MDELVIATGNPHKVEEIRAVLAPLGIARVRGLETFGRPLREPVEDGPDFESNAAIKARAYAAGTGLACLADDSGLMVDALDGAPGVISSHFATGGIETGVSRADRDAANNAALLERLAGVPAAERTARFVCVVVVASPDGRLLATARGEMPGRIGEPPRVPAGSHGFGYDPLFLPDETPGRTSAELTPNEKHAISHRGRALRALASHFVGGRADGRRPE